VSDFSPLFAGCFSAAQAERAVVAFEDSQLLQVGGAQTTTSNTGQQWDSPNVWAPEQSFRVDGFLKAGKVCSGDCSSTALRLASQIASRFVATTLQGWENGTAMHEKYNAFALGGGGHGGEYKPQVGFGWTNGVVLDFLNRSDVLLRDEYAREMWLTVGVPIAVALAVLVVFACCHYSARTKLKNAEDGGEYLQGRQ
jgi:alpha,alpha-trehalase